MTKEKKKIIKRKLHQKLLALVDQVSTIRQENGLTQKQLGDRIEMDKGQMSRFMSARKNVTLETVVRIEDFLDHEILTTPDDRDEALVKDPQRLWDIFDAALATDSRTYLTEQIISHPDIIRKAATTIIIKEDRRIKPTSSIHNYERINANRGEVDVIERTFSGELNTFSDAIAV